MILQSLCRYYDRLQKNDDVDIPPKGFSYEKIHYAIIIDKKGNLKKVKTLYEKDDKRIIPKILIVPSYGTKRTSKVRGNFLWDNTGYIFGLDKSKKKKKEFENFKKLHEAISMDCEEISLVAVTKFLNNLIDE